MMMDLIIIIIIFQPFSCFFFFFQGQAPPYNTIPIPRITKPLPPPESKCQEEIESNSSVKAAPVTFVLFLSGFMAMFLWENEDASFRNRPTETEHGEFDVCFRFFCCFLSTPTQLQAPPFSSKHLLKCPSPPQHAEKKAKASFMPSWWSVKMNTAFTFMVLWYSHFVWDGEGLFL